MSDETLSNKQMDEMDELVRQHDAAVLEANSRARSAQTVARDQKAPKVFVDSEAVRDVHKGAGNPEILKSGFMQILDAGQPVAIRNGEQIERVFQSSQDFAQWFDGITSAK